ncbi:MAG: HAD-IC family P-type ATPase [Candidatus Aenigmarchaeota archaeon]|nr:HAD-IC family P-type ATPase [Candidatus Aenigmarchaeota archaeon]
MDKWHTMNVDSVFNALKTSKNGLNEKNAQARLKQYGLNKLKSKKRKTVLLIFLEQFKSFLVILLLVAVVISIFLGIYSDESHFIDAAVIGAILILNAIFGFYQEYKAEKTLEALKKLVIPKVVVIRGGKHIEIKTEELVLGDIVLLESGNRVPADLRVFEDRDLKIDESTLTGESVPVKKTINILKDVAVAERKNMAFMGTLISYGRGKGVVTSTGMSTEMGKIAGMVQEKEEMTPLQVKLQKFGKSLGIVVIIITLIIFVLGTIRAEDIFNMFMIAMSLAISAVPEGLPAVITLTLAIGTQRMLKKNSIVKRLAAVESLGSTTVICADKTGTMTTNEMTVRKVWVSGKELDVTGVGFEPKGNFLLNKKKIDLKRTGSLDLLLKISSMCNDSILKERPRWHIIGDPTEGALKVLALKGGIKEYYKRVDEIPFSSERKKMTTVHEIENEFFAYTKGAPETILEICDGIYFNKKLTKRQKEKILEIVHQFASRGLRVLAFAYKKLGNKYSLKSVESNMNFVGLAAMIDPPRKETARAIALCKKAGIKVIMITGDHQLTAKAIGAEVGLIGKAMRGEEIDKIDDWKLKEIVEDITIFARVSPQHKLRIVEALRSRGHVVAMTGDGVNDAPALKKADVGVAMGIKGTDVSKEAADIILMDDNFSTIVSAVEEGRGIYDNIKKFVKFLLAANFDELFLVTLMVLLSIRDPATGLLAIPFLPVQLLWVNLITDGVPALALGVDPKEKDIMKRKPRNPKKGIIDGILLFIIIAAILAFSSAFILFNHVLQTEGLDKARTIIFTQTMLFEFFFVFNCRSEKKSAFRLNPLENKKLLIAILISIILQVVIIYTPMLQPIFGVVPLNAMDWVKIIIFSAVGLLVIPEIFIRNKE